MSQIKLPLGHFEAQRVSIMVLLEKYHVEKTVHFPLHEQEKLRKHTDCSEEQKFSIYPPCPVIIEELLPQDDQLMQQPLELMVLVTTC